MNVQVKAQFGILVPDSSFNFSSSVLNDTFKTQKMLLLDDGRILCAGSVIQLVPPNLFTNRFSIRCFLADGNIDNSFGDNGEILFNNGFNDENFWHLEKSGLNYLAVGTFNTIQGGWPLKNPIGDCFLFKFDDSGSAITTFGINGTKIISASPKFGVNEVKIDNNDDIYLLVNQQQFCGYDDRGKILKLSSQGNYDLNFGILGYAEFPLYLPQNFNILNDGRLVVLGTDTSSNLQYPYNTIGSSCWQAPHLCQLNSNGSVDYNFGINGKKLISYNNTGFISRSSVSIGTGFYLFGDEGFFETFHNLYNINNLGEFDSTFSDDGKINITIASSWNIYEQTLKFINNSLWMCGSIEIHNMNCRRKNIIRVTENGVLDSTLGYYSFSTEPIFDRDIEEFTINSGTPCYERSSWNDLIIQPDGKILATGLIFNYDTSITTIPRGFIISRLLPNDETLSNKNEIINLNALSVFPNPTSENINITLAQPEKIRISIFNSLGIQVKNTRIENAQYINNIELADLCSGVYFVEIKGNNWITTRKIIKK